VALITFISAEFDFILKRRLIGKTNLDENELSIFQQRGGLSTKKPLVRIIYTKFYVEADNA